VQSFQEHLCTEERHKVGVTMITQPRSAQPQINVFQGFDASTILKTRIPLCSFEEDGALLAHSFDLLLGGIAPMRFD
jgi:hypothetical protein